MSEQGPTWRSDVTVALLVGIGLLLAGVYDWLQGQPPPSLFPVPSGVRFAIFGCSVVAVVWLASMAALGRVDGPWWYGALAAAFIGTLAADPTYASLLVVLPLIAIRRRTDDPLRRWLTVGTLVAVATILLTEQAQRVETELEGMLVMAIALTIVIMLGDALRRMDEVRAVEADLVRADERNRLARDLHDSLGHNLLACSIQLRNAEAQHERSPEATARAIDLAGRAVAEALADTRLSVDSIQADSVGFSLDRALPDLVQRAAPASMTVDVKLEGDADSLDHLTQITLYRVAQEALSNIVRHANAGAAAIRVTVGASDVVLAATDDGDGFDLASASGSISGLQSIRERLARVGGRLDLQTEKGGGTTLTAVVPKVGGERE